MEEQELQPVVSSTHAPQLLCLFLGSMYLAIKAPDEEMLTQICSQPFWGEMVAAAGAGPRPIDHKILNEENLTAAIRHLLSPQTKQAAHNIAIKMRSENGVKLAVECFHRSLPYEGLTCDLLPQESAAWIYDAKASKKSNDLQKGNENKERKKYKGSLKLSPKAVAVLSEHNLIDLKKLKL